MADFIDCFRRAPTFLVLGIVAVFAGPAAAATLEVGPGKPFARIEEANAQARPGDVVLVYPRENGLPYEGTGVYVRRDHLTFRAVPAEGERWVAVSGEGFVHSGRGSVPRAIFQFNRGSDHCVLEGFALSGGNNKSHNGAGGRINQANHVTIRNCNIHHNDMGVMSGGDGSPEAGVNQRIEFCVIHHNGDFDDPGYNHNLYLGGTSVTLHGCEVHSSLTGHNVKSRAHHTRVEYSYVHHSANREFDLVDAADTARPESHAVLLGNVIVKDPKCRGNRGVVHFGQDGGREHDGTVYLIYNTVVTPFISPLVELSAPGAKAHLVGNLVSDGGVRQNNQRVAAARHGASEENVTGTCNWLSGGFSGLGGTGLDAESNLIRRVAGPMFARPSEHDYRLTAAMAKTAAAPRSAGEMRVPAVPGAPAGQSEFPLAWQYRHPAGVERRLREERLTVGAYGRRRVVGSE